MVPFPPVLPEATGWSSLQPRWALVLGCTAPSGRRHRGLPGHCPLGTGRPEVWPGRPGSSSLLWKLFLRETCWLLSGLWLPWKRSEDGRRGPHSRGCCLGPLPGRRVQTQGPETVALWSTQHGGLPQDWGLLGAGRTRGLGMEGRGPGVSDALPVSSRACSWRGHPAPKAPR